MRDNIVYLFDSGANRPYWISTGRHQLREWIDTNMTVGLVRTLAVRDVDLDTSWNSGV